MATIRLELFKGKTLAEGKHPICITVTKVIPRRKTIDACTLEEWDDKNKQIKVLRRKESAEIANRNRHIDDEFTKYKAIFKAFESSALNWKPEDIFKQPEIQEIAKKTFWQIADLYLSTLTGYTKASAEGKIEQFKKFVMNDNLLLHQIDSKLIAGYVHYMRTTEQRGGGVNKEGTIRSKLKAIRFVSNFGALHKYDTRPEELHNFKLPLDEPAETEFLTESELTAFANVELEGPSIKQAQHTFLLAVYLRGMRIGDIIQLKQSYFSKDRLRYTTGKTGKELEMELVPKAQQIINQYLDGREYLFHFYTFKYDRLYTPEQNDKRRTDHVKAITTNINNKLKKIAKRAGIEKNVRTHIARHSFANILDGNNVDIGIIQGLLGHGTRAMTEKYIKKIRHSAVLDQAVRDIFG